MRVRESKRQRERGRERESEREREIKYESEVVERKNVLSVPSPTFAKFTRNLRERKKLRYNPGFPASATYDGSHSLEAGSR